MKKSCVRLQLLSNFRTKLAMQTLLLPAARPGIGSAPLAPPPAGKSCRHSFLRRPTTLISSPSSLPFSPLKTEPLSLPQFRLISKRNRILASSPVSAPYTSPNDDSEKNKLAQVLPISAVTSVPFLQHFVNGFISQFVLECLTELGCWGCQWVCASMNQLLLLGFC